MKNKMNTVFLKSILCVSLIFIAALGVVSADDIGADTKNIGPSDVTIGSIVPQVTETGKVSLSVDGLGVYPGYTGTIQVEKPAGATVRKAYMAAATTGFRNYKLAAGDIKIDGTNVVWAIQTPSSISSWNYWADVTSIVKSKIDAALAGRVNFAITEKSTVTSNIDGELLAVIFDDPNQATDNTIVLLFGAQDIAGDTFAIGLAEPIDKSDPNLVLDMSLGISYGYQRFGGGQYSIVDVNTLRMTTSAGGEDDGDHTNGALLTVGGLDDSNANPSPYATPSNPRTDDELYTLLPFVSDGDTSINVYTQNPSNDDNIFFASLFLASTTAVVGEGILLAPVSASNPVGSQHTVTATVQDDDGNPVVGRDVTFTIVSGPHAGQTSTVQTDANGKATFTYTGTSAGTDVIEASFVDSQGNTITSNQVTKEWIIVNEPPKAHAGPDQTVEQAYYQGADVTLDGSGSSDPDGDPLTYSWTWPSGSATGVRPIVSLPLGTTTITLVVNDGTVDSAPDTVVITVQDTKPPVITCPADVTIEQETAAGTVVPLTATATDICDADPTITSDELAIYPLGTTTVTFTAKDDSGNSASCSMTVTVVDTTPPVITCPADVTVEQDTAAGTEVPLTATATDICDADPTITGDELAIYPLGETTVTFTATDDAGNSATCTTTVTVEDTTPPVITCPADVTVEQATAAGTEVPLTATATDICDADPTITSDELAIYPLGETTVTFTAIDDAGNSATCTTTVTVEDTTPPVITASGEQIVLWPPNHKYRTVEISDCVISVTDICDAAVIIDDIVITSVSSDEPEDAQGKGDGTTVDDIVIVDSKTVELRAERQGGGNGRVYTINFGVTDASGNTETGSCTVWVLHDQEPGSTAIDDGASAGYIVNYP